MARRNENKVPNNYKKYYSNTSEAYDFERQPNNRPAKKRVLKQKVKQKTLYKLQINHKIKFSPLTYLTIFILFIGCIGVLGFNAQISLKNLKIESMFNQLRSLEDENIFLKDEITNFDMNKIEEIATNKLGMKKPQPHQIIRIDIPEESYKIDYDLESEKVDKSFSIKKIFDIFSTAVYRN